MRSSLVPFLALVLAACPGQDGPTDDTLPDDTVPADTDVVDSEPAPDTDAGDTEVADTDESRRSTLIRKISPADGEAGVLPDAVIVIEFTRPMDTASVEASWSSERLGDAVSFVWNDDASVLTVVPDEDLPVADALEVLEGTAVDYAIGEGAVDSEGFALLGPSGATFRVARRHAVTLSAHPTRTGYVGSNGATSTANLWVGDDVDNTRFATVTTFVTRNLPTPLRVEHAELELDGTTRTGSPWSGLGDLRASWVTFPSLTGDVYDLPALTAPTTVPAFRADELLRVDVPGYLETMLASRSTYTEFFQLRLAFSIGTDADGVSDNQAFANDDAVKPLLHVDLLVE